MTARKAFGDDLSKWFIKRYRSGLWYVCPPVSDDPHQMYQGGGFATGAEALAAFAAGGAK